MADQHCYANRELSWLKFNQRVLEEAQDPANPLCERLSFLSIFIVGVSNYSMNFIITDIRNDGNINLMEI